MKKLSRTISGVTPVAVMSRPDGCPGKCLYCPTYTATPQSYTPESPAVLRARETGYDAGEQVARRLRALTNMGHPTSKIELIIMGGTFLAQETKYQYCFIKGCYDALNEVPSATLEEAQHRNETARCRAIGLCIETRPDWCGEAEIARMLEFGATRVELGVQTLDENIYRLVRREHSVDDVIQATARLKRAGLKVHYHWMPGLPGATPEGDLEMSRRLFRDPDFRPDGLKLYPTMVIGGTELEEWHRDGRYHPYDDETMINLICDIKTAVPKYVRISRVLRDIPAKFITGGLKNSLRDVVRQRLHDQGLACQCIRCREYGHRMKAGYTPGEPRLKRLDYESSGGWEIFLSFEDEYGTLFGLLRLRIQDAAGGHPAIVRELHVYGSEVALHERDLGSAQHQGWGRALLCEAECIAATEFGAKELAVLSGVGAREYYRTGFGYQNRGGYMVKKLSPVGLREEALTIHEEQP